MKSQLAPLVIGLPALLTLPLVSGQVPSRFLLEGSTLPSGMPGEVIDRLSAVSVHSSGSIAVLMDTSETNGLDQLIWGSVGGAPLGVMRRPVLGPSGITAYAVKEVAVNASELAHAPFVDQTALELRVDDRTILRAGATSTFAPAIWDSVLQHVGITSTGEPYAIARWDHPTTGAWVGSGLLLGDPLQPVLQLNDALQGQPGLVQNIQTGTVSVSGDGSHYACVVRVNCPGCDTFGEQLVAVQDGAALQAGGAPIRGSQPVPGSIGGAGEVWAGPFNIGVNNDGRYFVGGYTQPSSTSEAPRAFILRDGQFWLRGGDSIDGGTFKALRCAHWTADGLLVHMSLFTDDDDAEQTGIFVENRLLHATSQSVDWTGNGSVNPGYVTQSMRPTLTRPNYFAVSDDEVIYFGSVTVPSGGFRQGYFRLPYREGQNYCNAVPNSTGLPASMSAYGTDSASANSLSLTANRVPMGAFGFFITGDQQASVPMAGGSSGVLCVGGNIGRFVGPGQVQAASPGGVISLELDLTNHPQATGPITVTAGQTWNYSAWFRDATPQGSATSNFADAVSVQFR